MKKALSIIILCLPLLTGCGLLNFFKKSDPPIITEKVVVVDPKLLQPCDPLVTLVIPQGTQNKDPYLVENLTTNATIYANCRDSNDAKAAYIRKVTNNEITKKKD